MLEKSFSVLFYIKKPKGYTTGPAPVYMRITVDGIAKEIATKESCAPDRWNSQAQRVKGTNESSKSTNALLDTLERKVHDARRVLLDKGATVTTEAMKAVLTGKTEKPRMLMDLFRQHNAQVAALVPQEYSPATLGKYNTTLMHTENFLQQQYGTKDIEVRTLSFDFITAFEFYLKSVRKCNHNSALKNISILRKIVTFCLKSGWLQRDPFLGFKMAKKTVVREFLSEAELQVLTKKKFAIERLAQVRDVFLFSCYTGLAFIDVFQLTPDNIAKGVDGEQWIFTKRQKTDTPSRIPLLPQAKTILERYKKCPKCVYEGKVLPVISNQKLNAYLKEIADVCGITKTLTFHIARHTFATTVTLSNGVPIETVSKMLGHKSIKITQHYAKIIDTKVSADMQQLTQRLRATN